MRHIFVSLSFLICLSFAAHALSERERVLRELDDAIDNVAQYDSILHREIDHLRNDLRLNRANDYRTYETNLSLFRLFQSHECDSALFYINSNIELAKRMDRSDLLTESRIFKSSVLSKAGLFVEALQLLDSIDRPSLPDRLLGDYYHNYYDVYQFMSEYASNSPYASGYRQKSSAYRDSTLSNFNKDSFVYESLTAVKMAETGDESTPDYINGQIAKYQSGAREYSVLASDMAYYHRLHGDDDNQLIYYALAATSDIKGSVKENMALRALSELLYDDGDVERANRYLKKSMEDALYFSARMRSNQSAKTLPIVDREYDMMQKRYHRNYLYMIVFVSLFSLVLVAAVIMITSQKRRLAQRNREASEARDRANELNAELGEANSKIESTNTRLREADRIKEVYIRDLMLLCSNLINNTEQYRNKLYKLANSRDIQELYSQIKSTRVVNDSAHDFYATFDRAFLGIFPSFVEQFNSLLRPDEPVVPKPGEKLNTELRIYALIRLGVTESLRISDLLRCSPATIYTYRSKVRSRALNPDTLEHDVMQISAID